MNCQLWGLKPSRVWAGESLFADCAAEPHVDVMDWHGTRGGRDADVLFVEIATSLQSVAALGILTHHLVHDAAVWSFLERLFQLTRNHPACRWASARTISAPG